MLSTKDRVFDHFRILESVITRLQDVAEATHAEVPVHILGLAPAGPTTRTITPVTPASPVPNGTGEPLTEEDLAEQIEQPNPESEPEDQTTPKSQIVALERLQSEDHEASTLDEVFPDLESDDPEHQTDLDHTDPEEPTASRGKPRLLRIDIAAVLLLNHRRTRRALPGPHHAPHRSR